MFSTLLLKLKVLNDDFAEKKKSDLCGNVN